VIRQSIQTVGVTAASSSPAWTAKDGLATLGPYASVLIRELDDVFRGWGADRGALEVSYPGALPVEDLQGIDYFKNFPHLGTAMAGLAPDSIHLYVDDGLTGAAAVPPEHLDESRFILPSAACYPVYFNLRDTELDRDLLITTQASCYRNETSHNSLTRLWNFHMRELVFVGALDSAQAHLDHFRERVATFADGLGVALRLETATDPFFRPNDPRAMMQKIQPVKWEFVFGENCAIASLNSHRNFFGERCSITQNDGSLAFTSCVAFGLERWIHALSESFDGDLVAATAAVQAQGRDSLDHI